MERLNSEDHLLRKLIILLIVILLFIPCISLGQQVLPDGAIVEGDLEVESASGIDINPGSDTDTDLVTIGVTGSPVFGWDETNDAFTISKSIVFPALTATTVPYLDGNKVLTSSSVTPTELGYVSGVTSAIQTQIDSKVTDSFTASRVLESDGSGNAQASSVTSTTLGYLDATSSIQTQLDAKEPNVNLTINRAVVSDGSGDLAASTTTATEIGYVNGVTSAIQTQLDAKAPLDSPLFTTQAEIDNEGEFRFREDTANGTNYVSLRANASLGSNVSFVLPTADGSANQVLKTDGSGNLGWSSPLSNPMTTGGDIIYGGGSGAATRLANGSDNEVLRSTGGTTAPEWAALNNVTRQAFATGSGTYTTASGATLLRVTIVGAGGGGGGSGTSAGSAAGAGGNTTFGTMTATGGGAGGWLNGGANGSYSLSGYVTYQASYGQYGGNGQINPSTANGTQLSGGNGGAAGFGFGLAGRSGPGGGGVSGSGCGGGGGGAGTDNVGSQRGGGGGGGGGGVIFWIVGPTSSYSYSVGSGGSGGGAGTSGRTGGNGSNGCVIVEEFYF